LRLGWYIGGEVVDGWKGNFSGRKKLGNYGRRPAQDINTLRANFRPSALPVEASAREKSPTLCGRRSISPGDDLFVLYGYWGIWNVGMGVWIWFFQLFHFLQNE
jgi:hypothetical protein